MMRTPTWTLLMAAIAAASATSVSAQDARFSLEIRGGYDFPMGDLNDSGVESEVGFGGQAVYTFTPQVSVYGGWGRDQFGCDVCGSDDDDIHSSGLEGGVKLHPTRATNAHPWVRIGAIYHTFAGRIAGVEFESDRQVGLQLGLGVDLPLGQVMSVSPAVRFHSWTAKFDGPNGLDPTDSERGVRYLSVDLGARFLVR